jgi:hypothetical protein
MKAVREFLVNTVIGGLLILLPIYLAVLVAAQGHEIGRRVVAAHREGSPGLAAQRKPARAAPGFFRVLPARRPCAHAGRPSRSRTPRETFFGNLPGYDTIRSLSRRLAGQGDENEWKPAFAEIEDALVPAFIVEEHADGRLTVFVPSIPTPFAGAVYILERRRVHPLDVRSPTPSGASHGGGRDVPQTYPSHEQ